VSDPFSGALAKLDRAEHHLRVVNRISLSFERRKPYALSAKVEPTPALPQPHPVYRFVIHENPPALLPVLIGDCAHNLRSALDYIAWVLPRTPRPDDEDIQFPIWTTIDKWEPKSRRLGGLTRPACDAIKALQPFNGPSRIPGRPHDLANLLHLSNWDKHRQLVVGGIATRSIASYGEVPPFRIYSGPLPNDAIVMEFPPNGDVDMNPRFFGNVVFGEPEQVKALTPALTLELILDYIRDTVVPAMRSHL
jgi:hypothetical protein